MEDEVLVVTEVAVVAAVSDSVAAVVVGGEAREGAPVVPAVAAAVKAAVEVVAEMVSNTPPPQTR